MRALWTFFALATLLSASPINAIAILVDGTPITSYQIKTLMSEKSWNQEQAVDFLIFDTLKKNEITKRGITITEDELEFEIANIAKRNNTDLEGLKLALESRSIVYEEWKTNLKEQFIQQRLFADISRSTMEIPSEAELKMEFEKNKESYPNKAGIKAVKYLSATQQSLETIKLNPLQTLADVQKTEMDLSVSDEDEEILKALRETPPLEFSTIFSSPSGYYMYLIQEITEPKKVEFADVREMIVAKVMQEKEQSLAREFFEKLKTKASIKTLRSIDD